MKVSIPISLIIQMMEINERMKICQSLRKYCPEIYKEQVEAILKEYC